jgi:hypothetical protein
MLLVITRARMPSSTERPLDVLAIADDDDRLAGGDFSRSEMLQKTDVHRAQPHEQSSFFSRRRGEAGGPSSARAILPSDVWTCRMSRGLADSRE